MQQLRVWWMPQVPGPSFDMRVKSVEEGVKIMQTLAEYDTFQYEHQIKPDFSNAGGLQMSDDKGVTWDDWEINDGQLGYFDDPEDYIELVGVLEEY